MSEKVITIHVNNDIPAVNRKLMSVTCGDHILFAEGGDDISGAALKEMITILELCERHGAVVPYGPAPGHVSPETAAHLPAFKVIPYANTFPVLIKADLFLKFGFLDDSFECIYDSIAEFCLRVNRYGWNTVRANHVRTLSGAGIDCAKCDEIIKRFPYINKPEKAGICFGEYAAEHFAGLLCGNERKKSILFSLYEVPAVFNGTSNYAMKLLDSFFALYRETYDISILAFQDTISFHRLSEKYGKIYTPDTVADMTFDLGYSVSQIYDLRHLAVLNRCCLKIGVCMLDIIGLRSVYLLSRAPERFIAFRDSVCCADLLLSISRFSLNDIQSFFADETIAAGAETGYVYLATDKTCAPGQDRQGGPEPSCRRYKVPFAANAYYIVVGNTFQHKFTQETIEEICQLDENFIVVGTKTEGWCGKKKNVYGYVSGWLEEGLLDHLIQCSRGIIFPSVYEGFGLTVFDALVYNKRILVSDTEVNRELLAAFDPDRKYACTYTTTEELKSFIRADNTLPERVTPVCIRSWNDAAADLEKYFDRVLQKDTSPERLEKRWKYFQIYDLFQDVHKKGRADSRKGLMVQKCIRRFPGLYQIFRKIVVKIDKGHYGNGSE